jgi:3-oxosteroid 1-dehydrogenase
MSRWDHEADVVIVGAGGAALSAAAAAIEAGAKVMLLEAGEEPGGTTRLSGGAFWIPNNTLMRAAGASDPRDPALRLMARLSYPSLYDPEAPLLGLPANEHALLAAFYDHGAGVTDALIRLGAIDPMILPPLGFGPSPLSDPDYHAELPENAAPYGRVLTAKVPPGVMAWPGAFLAGGMIDHVRAKDAPILVRHRVVRALTNGHGEVIGVEAEHDGRARAIRARRGVVFATGGFAHDAARVRAHLRGPIFGSGSAATANGAFLDIAARLGASFGNLQNGFFYQAALEEMLETGGAVRRPDAHAFLPYGDSTILVNKYGRRCVNEKAMYHVRAQSHFHWAGTEYPNLVQIMLWDAWVANEPTFFPWRGVVPMPGMESPFVVRADTLEELASLLDARLARLRGRQSGSAAVGPDVRLAPDFVPNLRATIQRFNGFAESGADLDFHRGETPIQPAWQGPSRNGPNRTMSPIAPTGPYYALLLGAATLDTCGGPRIDPAGRVLRDDGTPIPGLFGAGNAVASPAGHGYWGAGGTIGPALVFGFLAGQSAAREVERPA